MISLRSSETMRELETINISSGQESVKKISRLTA